MTSGIGNVLKRLSTVTITTTSPPVDPHGALNQPVALKPGLMDERAPMAAATSGRRERVIMAQPQYFPS